MWKRYGIIGLVGLLLAGLAAARLLRDDAPPPKQTPPTPPERPAADVQTPPASNPTPPATTPSRNGKTPVPPPAASMRFEPTDRLSELLEMDELLRPEIVEELSRHIEKEGESLAAQGLLVPLQGLFDLLVAGRTLREAIAWLIENHQGAGREALMGHLDFQVRHTRARAVTGVDPKKIKRDQEKLNRLEEMRTELERSLLGP